MLSGGAEAAKSFRVTEDTAITPFLGLEGHYTVVDGFTETGAGVANLSVSKQTQTYIFSNIGSRVEHKLEFGEDALTLQANAGLKSELTNPNRNRTASLAGQTFQINAQDMSRHAATLGAGLTAEFASGLALAAIIHDGVVSFIRRDQTAGFHGWCFSGYIVSVRG